MGKSEKVLKYKNLSLKKDIKYKYKELKELPSLNRFEKELHIEKLKFLSIMCQYNSEKDIEKKNLIAKELNSEIDYTKEKFSYLYQLYSDAMYVEMKKNIKPEDRKTAVYKKIYDKYSNVYVQALNFWFDIKKENKISLNIN